MKIKKKMSIKANIDDLKKTINERPGFENLRNFVAKLMDNYFSDKTMSKEEIKRFVEDNKYLINYNEEIKNIVEQKMNTIVITLGSFEENLDISNINEDITKINEDITKDEVNIPDLNPDSGNKSIINEQLGLKLSI